MTATASRVSHAWFSDGFDNADSSSSGCSLISSSPVGSRKCIAGPSREYITPLDIACSASRSSRRVVIFSPQNDTKFFDSSESILPSSSPKKNALLPPPPSIRSYLHEQDQNAPDFTYTTPTITRILGKGNNFALTPPTTVKPILRKTRVNQIRLASSVEEGTLNNKEPARLIVSGQRPKLVARDSFDIATMRKAAAMESGVNGNGKGKGKAVMEEIPVPGSDDSVISEDGMEIEQIRTDREGSDESEEEETVEANGGLVTASLVDIILNGADDLLTLEEAYHTLTQRLRSKISPKSISSPSDLAVGNDEAIRIAVQPIKDEAPAMVRAIQRDISRLLGKVPNSELNSDGRDSSPFRNIQPLHSPTNRTPSPTPTSKGGKKSPQEPKQGYTEAEVRYRREASGVGAATLRFLSAVYHLPQLYTCFSEADLTSILDQIMVIPRAPKLPTPNPKRTYYLAILIISQMRIPASAVRPIKEKIVRAAEAAILDNIGVSTAGGPIGGKEGPGAQVKSQGYLAVINLLSTYTSLFIDTYPELLPPSLRGLTQQSIPMRYKASAACAAFVNAKLHIVQSTLKQFESDPTDSKRDEWQRVKMIVQKIEFFTVSHLKSSLKNPGRNGFVLGNNGERKTEGAALELVFKDKIGTPDGVTWACATWGIVVSLMGSAYNSSGLQIGLDHIMDRSLQPSNNTVRPLLARTGWNHAIHSYLSSGTMISISPENKMIRSFKPYQTSSHQDVSERLHTIQLPVDLALQMANAPNSAERILSTPDDSGGVQKYMWQRSEKSKRRNWMITCGLSAIPIIYAYSGMALYHQDQPAKEMIQISGLPSSDSGHLGETSKDNEDHGLLARLDQTWEKIVEPILSGMMVIDGVDKLKVTGWSILSSLTSMEISSEGDKHQWCLDDILAGRYLSGSVFGIEKEIPVVEMMAFIEDESLKANTIPSWGYKWIVSNMEKMLDLFDSAMKGVRGIDNIESVSWVKNENGDLFIPRKLDVIWVNLLKAISEAEKDENMADSVNDSYRLVMEYLTKVWKLDVGKYLPVGMFYADGKCIQDLQVTTLSIFRRFLSTTIEVLGEKSLNEVEFEVPKSASSSTKDGNKATGNITTNLMNMLLGSVPMYEDLDVASREIYQDLWSRSIATGSINNLSLSLTTLRSVKDESEWLQLTIWRCFAGRWTEKKDDRPSLQSCVDLLVCPFEDKAINAVWHLDPRESDLEFWTELAAAAVEGAEANGMGSNQVVLEAVAEGLGRSFESHPKTGSSTISISCLVALGRLVVLLPSASIAKKLFTLISQSLVESYPTPASLSDDSQDILSPALVHMFGVINNIIQHAPIETVYETISNLKAGICLWMADDVEIIDDDLGKILDELYCRTLSRLSGAMMGAYIPQSTQTLDDLLDIFGPRLSRALSPSVPKAFQSFWSTCFENQLLEYSEDVRRFLMDVLAAVPGMIKVPGLVVEEILSEEESQKKFPHSLQLGSPLEIRLPQQASKETDQSSLATDEHVSGMVNVVSELFPEITSVNVEEDDADHGDDHQQRQFGNEMIDTQPLPIDAVADTSPNPSEVDSERVEEEIDTNDVFGPPALVTHQRKRDKNPRKRPLGATRSAPDISKRQKLEVSSSASNSLPTAKELVPPTQDDEIEVFVSSDEHPDATKTSILNSAGRWLAKASSFAFFSPNRTTFDPPGTEVIPGTGSTKTSSSRKRSGKNYEIDSKTTPTDSKRKRTENGSKDSKRKKRDSASSRSSRSRSSSVVNDIHNPIEIDDGSDDELLLSPESARLRRQEEDSEIKQRSIDNLPGNQLMNRAVKWESNSTSSATKSASGASRSRELPYTQGRFDDAPEDQQVMKQRPNLSVPGGPAEPGLPQPSPSRTAQQARVLAMIEEAASNTALIANMDYDGIMRLMSSVDSIREAMTGNLQERAMRERKSRK